MEPIASIAGLLFRLEDVLQREMPEVDGVVITEFEGSPVRRLEEAGETFLVLDHRRDAGSAPCRVEFWRCLFAGESSVAGLYVLADLRTASPVVNRASLAGATRPMGGQPMLEAEPASP